MSDKQRLFEQMVLGGVPIDGGDMAATLAPARPSSVKNKECNMM